MSGERLVGSLLVNRGPRSGFRRDILTLYFRFRSSPTCRKTCRSHGLKSSAGRVMRRAPPPIGSRQVFGTIIRVTYGRPTGVLSNDIIPKIMSGRAGAFSSILKTSSLAVVTITKTSSSAEREGNRHLNRKHACPRVSTTCGGSMRVRQRRGRRSPETEQIVRSLAREGQERHCAAPASRRHAADPLRMRLRRTGAGLTCQSSDPRRRAHAGVAAQPIEPVSLASYRRVRPRWRRRSLDLC